MKLHWEILDKKRTALLRALAENLPPDYYLAGGTGLALMIGHRRSVDFDFFCQAKTLALKNENALRQSLKAAGPHQIQTESEGTLYLDFSGVRVSFLAFKPPLLEKTIQDEGLKIAPLVDIALMKLSAIIGRGSRRDFYDLAFLLRTGISLEALLSLTARKYPDAPAFNLTALKALTYFNDAEPEPDPVLIDRAFTWQEIKKLLLKESKRVAPLILNF